MFTDISDIGPKIKKKVGVCRKLNVYWHLSENKKHGECVIK